LSPGDIVMLTAAVRDLHRCYPGRFQTDVRTRCPDLWQHNPYLTPLAEDDAGVEKLDCRYPLINRCDRTPYHCLHGFIEFLNERLGLAIRPTAFKGDIHLSAEERAWYSQVHEWTGEDTPFWIVVAGGKQDVTVKWWSAERYQAVVDHFRGRIQFVQVGQRGHFHPRLDGVIDLRGKTSLREFVRLIYHSRGVLCPVTAAMHLAAAVDTKPGRARTRPCVVVAGGREPAYWEAYPGHQFIHMNGALPCCAAAGCWKDRTIRLRDGNRRDKPDHLCVNVVGSLPRCMDMIAAADVIGRIKTYFEGGMTRYLSRRQAAAALRGVKASERNEFDRQPLNIHFAGLALDGECRQLLAFPNGKYRGRGIIICAASGSQIVSAWVSVNLLRRSGCKLPVQLWHRSTAGIDHQLLGLLRAQGVECINIRKASDYPADRPACQQHLAPYAILHSCFREIMLLDPGTFCLEDPCRLFDAIQFREKGAVFWPDASRQTTRRARAVWRSCGLSLPQEPEFDGGQMLIDKERCWPALALGLWMNQNADFYGRFFSGCKEMFHVAFRKLKIKYLLVPKPGHHRVGFGLQHDFNGRRIFHRRNSGRPDLFPHRKNTSAPLIEKQCEEYVGQLRGCWFGGMRTSLQNHLDGIGKLNLARPPVRITAVMISCEPRNSLRHQTLRRLAATDWNEAPLIEFDDGIGDNGIERQLQSTFRVLQRGLGLNSDYLLFIEDDLLFNRYLRHNVLNWRPLQAGLVTLASLYNPNLDWIACDIRHHARIVEPHLVFGSQAFLIRKDTVKYLVRNWHRGGAGQDLKMARLVGAMRKPIFYHAPSLVQHVGFKSAWGGKFHQAPDFDPEWKA
jgi:ADP-heptose:LPS heptosyltransferase